MTLNRVQISVRFATDSSPYALWHVMRKGREIRIGLVEKRNPSTFNASEVGRILVRLEKQFPGQLAAVEIIPAIDYDAVPPADDHGYGSSPGYSEACGVWN